jgi:uncharacterized protein (TIGR01777 family)
MNILITGGTGFIGSELCAMLLQQGHYLTIITRSPKQHAEEQAKNQQFISWDANLTEVMEKADAVINLVGENIFGQRWTDEVKERIYSSRIDNTQRLVSAIKQSEDPPNVMVSASAAGYYGGRGTDVLDEEEPPGKGFLSKVCVDWEKAAAPVQQAGVRLAIPRIGIVLEKGGGALQKMVPPFKFFVGGPIGRGTQFVPWIHRHDLCRGLLYPLENEGFEGVYNLNAPNPVTMEELANAIGDVLNRPSAFRVPEFLLNIVLGEAAKPILESLRVQPKHLQNAGFECRYQKVREALSEIL